MQGWSNATTTSDDMTFLVRGNSPQHAQYLVNQLSEVMKGYCKVTELQLCQEKSYALWLRPGRGTKPYVGGAAPTWGKVVERPTYSHVNEQRARPTTKKKKGPDQAAR